MKNLLILAIGLLAGAGGWWLISHGQQDESGGGAATPSEETSLAPGLFKLSPEQRQAAGIQTTNPSPASVSEEVKGYGRVLDPTPILSVKIEIDAARAAVQASESEYERVKILYGQNQNASARTVESAEAMLKRDQAQLALAEAKLQMALGPVAGKREDLDGMLDRVGSFEAALFRFELVSPPPDPIVTNLEVAPMVNETHRFPAELLGAAAMADPALQAKGFLGLLGGHAIAPNQGIAVWVTNPGHPVSGFMVPSSAVLQEGPESVIFVEAGENEFRKVAIHPREQPGGLFVTNGLAADDRVVVQGAHQILSMSRAEPAE